MEQLAPKQPDTIWTANFYFLCLANLLLFMSIMLLLPTLPIYIISIGGDQRVVGLVMGVFTISAMAVRPLGGFAVDRFGRKNVLLIGIILMFSVSLFYHLVATAALLFLIRLLHGTTYSISTTATGTMAADILPTSRLGEGMGYFGLASSLSMALAPLLGIWLIDNYGYFELFSSINVLALCAMLAVLCISYTSKLKPPATTVRWNNVFEKSAIPISLVTFFLATVFGAIISFVALHARELGIGLIGLFFTAKALAMMISRPISGRWSDRHGAGAIVMVGHLITVLSLVLVAMSESTSVFIFGGVAYGIGFGLCMPTLQALAVKNLAPERRGAATGTYYTAFDLGIGLGTVLWGIIASLLGYKLMFLSAVIPTLLAALLFYRANLDKKEAEVSSA